MIPKIIHYCWFGGNELPESVKKCIDSWKKFAPDYELKLWNESNYDVNSHPYIKAAYENKKYAFVTDYVRLDVVNTYGGIYLDTDVELIKPINHFLTLGAFMALEQPGRVATGLGFGAKANNPVISANLKAYDNLNFIENGKQNLTTCVTVTMDTLKQLTSNLGINIEKLNSTQFIKDLNLTILSTEVMCPYSLETGKTTITKDTVSIHHYDATWKPHKDHLLRLKVKLRNWIGSDRYERLKLKLKS